MKFSISKSILVLLLTKFISVTLAAPMPDQFTSPEAFNPSSEYLKDMPKLTKENLRFLLPAGNWSWLPMVLAKGKYLRVFQKNAQDPSVGYSVDINVYDNKKLEGKPVFSVDGSGVRIGGRTCSRTSPGPLKLAKQFLSCGAFYCRKVESNEPQAILNYEGLNDSLFLDDPRNPNKTEPCPYKPEVFVSTYGSYDITSYDIKIDHIPEDKAVAEIKLNGKSLFLDTKFCVKTPKNCEFLDVPFSLLEIAWTNLKYAQDNKKFTDFNILREKLLPCVLKKDKTCVQKFIVTKEEADRYGFADLPAPLGPVTDEILIDLEKCLQYENLLPYGGRSRATGDKICIFYHKKIPRIYNITLPDAYKYSGGEEYVNYQLE